MALTRWSPTPFSLMRNAMREMDSMFRDAFDSFGVLSPDTPSTAHELLPLDVYETPDALYVKACIPGVDPENVRVTTERGLLRIEAHIPSDAERDEAKDWRWHHREAWYGDITRTISLPSTVDSEGADASFANGVLTLRFPKSEAAKPRQIPVRLVHNGEAAQPQLEASTS